MLNNDELNTALEKSPAPRVTPDYIEGRIVDKKYHRLSGTLMVCEILVDNGFVVIGESACASPENFNQEIGEKVSYDNAFRKLWPLFGFLLAEKQFIGFCDGAVTETEEDESA